MTKHHQSMQDAIDESILDVFQYEPHYSEWVLVEHRIDPMHFFAIFSISESFKCLPSTDCLRVFSSHDNSTIGIIGISTITAGARPTYLVSFNLNEASVYALVALDVFKNITARFSPLMFPDSDILTQITAEKSNHNEIVFNYLHHPDRTRPVFIKRNTTSLSRSRKLSKRRSNILIALGPVITNTALFAEFKPENTMSRETLCVLPDHDVLLFNQLDVDTFESDIDELFLAQKPFSFDAYPDQTAPLSPAVLKIWGTHNFVPLPSLAELNEHAEEDYLSWYTFLETLDARNNTAEPADLPNPETIPETIEVEPTSITILDRSIETDDYQPTPALGPDDIPTSCADIAPWVEANFSDTIAIIPRAARALAKSRHPNPERIARALRALAQQKHACYSAQDRKNALGAFEQQLQDLYMRDTFTNAERLQGRTGDAYLITHQGRRLLLDRHLASQSSGFNDPKLVRIYYCFDRQSGKIVVGHLPDHLPTSLK